VIGSPTVGPHLIRHVEFRLVAPTYRQNLNHGAQMKYVLIMNTPRDGYSQYLAWPKKILEANQAFMQEFSMKLAKSGELVGTCELGDAGTPCDVVLPSRIVRDGVNSLTLAAVPSSPAAPSPVLFQGAHLVRRPER